MSIFVSEPVTVVVNTVHCLFVNFTITIVINTIIDHVHFEHLLYIESQRIQLLGIIRALFTEQIGD